MSVRGRERLEKQLSSSHPPCGGGEWRQFQRTSLASLSTNSRSLGGPELQGIGLL